MILHISIQYESFYSQSETVSSTAWGQQQFNISHLFVYI